MKATLPIVGGYNIERDPKIDCQRTINMYAVNSPEGKNPSALVSLPGIKSVLQFEEGTIVRSLYVSHNLLFAVVSNHLYQINPNLNVTLLGSLSSSTGFVDITANQTQLFITDGTDGWTYTFSTGVLALITDAAFPTLPGSAVMLDGFFLTHQVDSNQFVSSDHASPPIWPADYDAYLESEPDTIQRLFVFKRRIYVFGKIVTEVWYNAGTADFPFRRDNNMIFNYGCAAVESVAVGGSAESSVMFWLASMKNGSVGVMMTDGSTPKRISTPAIDYALKNFNDITDAVGYSYMEDGHLFYEVSFTEDNRTFVYDLTTGLWFERKMQNGDRFIANSHSYFNDNHYVGSYTTPTLYRMSGNILDEDGDITVRTRIFRHLAEPHYRKIRINRLTLDMTEGRDHFNNSLELRDTLGEDYLSLEYGVVSFADILLEDEAKYTLEDEGHFDLEDIESIIIGEENGAYLFEDGGLVLAEASITEREIIHEPDPYVNLSVSKDGGVSYGPTWRIPSGNLGERLHRTIFRRLGSGRDWVFKLTIENRRPLFILGASIDFEVSGR